MHYTYAPNGHQVSTLEYRLDASSVLARTSRAYEGDGATSPGNARDLIASIANDWLPGQPGAAMLSKYLYENDVLGRRDEVGRTGAAFSGLYGNSPEHKDRWGYDARNQLTASNRFNDTLPGAGHTSNPEPTRDYGYVFDTMGNRTSTAYNANGAPQTALYGVNQLNQYSRANIDNTSELIANRLRYDADGNLAKSLLVADLNCDGSISPFDIQAFMLAIQNPQPPPPEDYATVYPNCDRMNADINGDGTINPFDIQGFIALLEGNGGSAPDTVGTLHRRYTWDAENRLIRDEPEMSNPPDGSVKSEFAYDYLGRRTRRHVWTRFEGNWIPQSDWRYVYDGWNVILEFRKDLEPTPPNEPPPPPAVLRKYTWGLDVAGLSGNPNPDRKGAGLQAAAGIGGLLAVYDTAGTTQAGSGPGGDPLADDRTFLYFYDANGNVGQLIETTGGPGGANPQDPPGPAYGTLAARYEYDPYGNRSNPAGENEYDQPFRFSTRPFDAETGFYAYIFRYYSPRMGRWVNRDPLGETGGLNLYDFVRNQPTKEVDPLGLYQRDFHYYVIYLLLRAKCFTPEDAGNIAGFSQYADDDPKTEAVQQTVDDQLEVVRHFHFAGSDKNTPTMRNDPGAQKAARDAFCEFTEKGSIDAAARLGMALHTYADTWSHEGFTPWWNSAVNRRAGAWFRPNMGHADAPEGGNAPDLPFNDVAKALEAAHAIFDLIPSRCCSKSRGTSWDSIESGLRAAFETREREREKREPIHQALIRSTFGDEASYDLKKFNTESMKKLFHKAIELDRYVEDHRCKHEKAMP